MTFFIVVELLVILLIALVIVVGVVDAVGSRSWRVRLPLASGAAGAAQHWRRFIGTPRERRRAPSTPRRARKPRSRSYRISAGAGELLADFVTRNAAQLDGRWAATPADAAVVEALVDAIPDGRQQLEQGKLLRVVGPAAVLPLAASGRVELATPSGELAGKLRDGSGSAFAGQSRFGRADAVSAPGATDLIESRPAGSVFLPRVDNLLEPARENTARLLHRQRGDAFEKCAGAARLCAQMRRELLDDPRGEYDGRDLRAADRLAARPYEQARASLARFAERAERFRLDDAKPATLRGLWKRGTEAVLEDARLLACCAAVRYERSLLEAAAVVRRDPGRAGNLMHEAEQLRQRLLADLAIVMTIIGALSFNRSALEQRFRRGTARLIRNAEAFKRRARPMRRLIEEAQTALLPPAPRVDIGFLIELAAQDDGALTALEAALETTAAG